MKFLCKRTNNRGASLVELLIVVAIMSVIMSVFIPTYVSYVEKSRVQQWLSEADSFYSVFEMSLLDARAQGYEPSAGEVVLVDGQIHEIWGSEFGITVESIVRGCFGAELDQIHDVHVCFDDLGISQYYYFEFVRGSHTYKYYNIIDASFSGIIPADAEVERLTGNWRLVKE